ncbi:MAG: glycosyltransferase family 39 protein [Candidatus Doudnabacteria bacterium]|nr:glycosyltransferase family 39 protein [Candidatus Doudnabacteria bacterium]
MRNFIRANWPIILIVILGIFFRFWRIDQLPGGLFPDEAANGLDVNAILNGDIQPFYERGNGREALFFYFLAISVALFGRGPWQHHIISAGFGLLAVVATYFLTKRMFGKRVALLASFFMAVSSYAVTISRTAFRANAVPLLSILTLYFLICFFSARGGQTQEQKKKYWYAALSGLSFALGFYTYISFRMLLPLLFVFAIILIYSQRHRIKKLIQEYWAYKLAFAAAFLAGFGWLGYYFLTHPGTFVGRAGQVSIFSPALNNGSILETFIEVFKATMLSFFTVGDLNWRHNVAGYPFLSVFISPFFAFALILCTWAIFRLLKNAWERKLNETTTYQSLTAVWFYFMLIPEITTAEGIPHGLRLIGVIPPIFILSAWGVDWFWQKISAYSRLPYTRSLIAFVFLFSIFIYNYYAYFAVAAASSDYYYAFRSDLTTVSNYLIQRNQKTKTYLALDKFSVQTVDYLTTEKSQPYVLLVPENTYQVQLEKGDQVIFTQSSLIDSNKFEQYHPRAKLIKVEQNKFKEVIMLLYEQL